MRRRSERRWRMGLFFIKLSRNMAPGEGNKREGGSGGEEEGAAGRYGLALAEPKAGWDRGKREEKGSWTKEENLFAPPEGEGEGPTLFRHGGGAILSAEAYVLKVNNQEGGVSVHMWGECAVLHRWGCTKSTPRKQRWGSEDPHEMWTMYISSLCGRRDVVSFHHGFDGGGIGSNNDIQHIYGGRMVCWKARKKIVVSFGRVRLL